MTSPEHHAAARHFSLTTASLPEREILMKRPGYEGVQRMDTRPTTLDDRFRIDADYDWMVGEKARLLATYPSYTHQMTPGARRGSLELLFEALPILAKTYPHRFSYSGGTFCDLQTRVATIVSPDDPTPLKTLSILVQEDITLLHRDTDGIYRLAAGCVCFPSDWSLTSKLGMSVQEIHTKVPELNHKIGKKIDILMDTLKPDRPVSRVNLLLNFNPTLSQIPEAPELIEYPRPCLNLDSIGQRLWLRNEYETLSKLGDSEDIVFTIRTHQTKLCDIPPVVARHLIDMHNGMPEPYLKNFRKLSQEEHALLLQYLDMLANGRHQASIETGKPL